MKKRFTLIFASLTVALAFAVAGICGFTAVSANADDEEKTIDHIESVENEFLYYGDVVESTATAHYTDGTAEELPIEWDNLSAIDVNRNFSMTEAIGTVAGTDERVSRRFFTMPKGLVYFVNCGSTTGNEDEGYDDIYYGLNTAIIDNYEAPTASHKLLNETADQELKSGMNWGYAHYSASYPISNKRMPTKEGDPMPPAYPYNAIRSTDSKDNDYGVKYTLGGLDASKSYRIYLGTRSHWHMRRCTVWVNGAETAQLEISAVAKITVYDDIAPNTNDGVADSIQIWLKGASQDEGNCAFIAVQPMEEANKTADAAPEQVTVDGNLNMGQYTFEIGNVKEGDKLQVALADAPYNILYEEIAKAESIGEDGKYTVTVPDGTFDGVFALRLTAVNTAGASNAIVIYITDITEYSFVPRSTAYTTDGVVFDISGKADSAIVRLVVNFDYVDTVFDENDDPDFGLDEYSGIYTARKNGLYTFTLYSGNGAFVSDTYNVTTIDDSDVTLSLNLATSGYAADGKTRVTLAYEGATEAVKYNVYNAIGEKLSEGTDMSSVLELGTGRYVVTAVSASGKTATSSVVVTEKPTYFTVETESISGGKTYTLEGAGKEISRFFAYGVSESGSATRLMGSGNSVNEYSGDEVVMKVEFEDGTVEMVRLSADFDSGSSSGKKKCGSSLGAASAACAAVLLAASAVMLVRRKRTAD